LNPQLNGYRVIVRWHEFVLDAVDNNVVHSRSLQVPIWFLFAMTAVLPVLWALRLRAILARRRPGHCPTCNYDLRATPDRCPECGTVPKGAKA
jgi:hypothetical protein